MGAFPTLMTRLEVDGPRMMPRTPLVHSIKRGATESLPEHIQFADHDCAGLERRRTSRVACPTNRRTEPRRCSGRQAPEDRPRVEERIEAAHHPGEPARGLKLLTVGDKPDALAASDDRE